MGRLNEARQRRVILLVFIFIYRFIQKSKDILGAARKMREELAKIPDITVCSKDDVTIILYPKLFLDLCSEFHLREV